MDDDLRRRRRRRRSGALHEVHTRRRRRRRRRRQRDDDERGEELRRERALGCRYSSARRRLSSGAGEPLRENLKLSGGPREAAGAVTANPAVAGARD